MSAIAVADGIAMSENSQINSVSYQNLFSRMKGVKPVAKAPVVKQEVNTASDYSQGTREVSKYGYEVYNIQDGGEVYISKAPESVKFNDGEPMIVKADSGAFVGLYRSPSKMELEDVSSKPRPVKEMFKNVKRGSEATIDSYVG